MYIASKQYTIARAAETRTHTENDDGVMAQDMRRARHQTKRAKMGEGLRLTVRLRKQVRALKILKGLGWHGDLDGMRRDRPSHSS